MEPRCRSQKSKKYLEIPAPMSLNTSAKIKQKFEKLDIYPFLG